MSAAGRGAIRRPDDFYQTPSWCVHRLFDYVNLPNGRWLEPAAGNGAIIEAVNAKCSAFLKIQWTAIELRPEAERHLAKVVRGGRLFAGFDFLQATDNGGKFDVIITNPPFSKALDFIEHALKLSQWVVMLVRLNFLSSAERRSFFEFRMPDVYILPNRPSFTEDGRTDATEYCWLVWPPERNRVVGRISILRETPLEVRSRRGVRAKRDMAAEGA